MRNWTQAFCHHLQHRPFLFLSGLGLALMLPTLLWGPGASHSHMYNYMWTSHLGGQMVQGNLYERWLPDSFEGLGSPTFYFYPPFAYWVAGAFNALGLSVFQAINMAGVALLIASGVTMHAFLKDRTPHPLTGAALYMAAPYHLYDFYVRGALAEFACFIWLPLIAVGIAQLPARRGVLLLAGSYAGLLLTHLPLAMLTALFLIAPLLAQRIWQAPRALTTGALAGVLALGLSAFYLLSAVTLQEKVSTNLLWNDLYVATHWSIWTSTLALFPCLALGWMLLAWPARSIWAAIAVVTGLASVRLIPFLWDIDLLNKAQFPWRALCIVEFAAVTALMSYRPQAVTRAAGAIILFFPYVCLIVLTQHNLYEPVDYARIARVRPDAPEYLPAGFDPTKVDRYDRWTDLSSVRALPRGETIEVRRAGPVTLGHAAFPIWRVTRDGHLVSYTGPLIHFDAKPGTYRIERVSIWQERWGAAISMLALLACMLMALGPWHRAISLLSKFPAYSPFHPDRICARSGSVRQSGGES